MILLIEFEIDFGISDAIPWHWVFFYGFGICSIFGSSDTISWNAGHSLDVLAKFGWVNEAHLSLLYSSVAV